MKPLKLLVCFGLCLSVLCIGPGSPARAQDKVEIKLSHPEGRTVIYKHKYAFAYQSDRAELLIAGRTQQGSTDGQIQGEWKSHETIQPVVPVRGEEIEPGTVQVTATIKDGVNSFFFERKRLTYDQYPFTLDQLDNRQVFWRVAPDGSIGGFYPDFSPMEINRADIITDIWQVWIPELHPVLPKGAVGKDDTWTGEQRFERNFQMLDMAGVVEFKSTYKVKKISKKKGRVVVELEEEREVRYKTWKEIKPMSIIIDGEGEGKGKWEIDVTRGLVLSHKSRMTITRPEIRLPHEKKPVDTIRAEVTMDYERKLDKVEKE